MKPTKYSRYEIECEKKHLCSSCFYVFFQVSWFGHWIKGKLLKWSDARDPKLLLLTVYWLLRKLFKLHDRIENLVWPLNFKALNIFSQIIDFYLYFTPKSVKVQWHSRRKGFAIQFEIFKRLLEFKFLIGKSTPVQLKSLVGTNKRHLMILAI